MVAAESRAALLPNPGTASVATCSRSRLSRAITIDSLPSFGRRGLSHEDGPLWELKSIKGLVRQDNLHVSFRSCSSVHGISGAGGRRGSEEDVGIGRRAKKSCGGWSRRGGLPRSDHSQPVPKRSTRQGLRSTKLGLDLRVGERGLPPPSAVAISQTLAERATAGQLAALIVGRSKCQTARRVPRRNHARGIRRRLRIDVMGWPPPSTATSERWWRRFRSKF